MHIQVLVCLLDRTRVCALWDESVWGPTLGSFCDLLLFFLMAHGVIVKLSIKFEDLRRKSLVNRGEV